MKKCALAFLAGFALMGAIFLAVQWRGAVEADTKPADAAIKDGIAAADAELMSMIGHVPTVRRKVEVGRDEIAHKIFSVSGDELAVVALERAERYRRNLIASSDLQ